MPYTNCRLRAGTWDASAMTTAYAVANFPTQADQRHIKWRVVSPSGFMNEYDAYTEGGLDGTVRAIGRWNGEIVIAAATPMMLEYIRDTLFPTDGVNEDLTIVNYSVARSGLVCINAKATLRLGRPAEMAEPFPGQGAVVQVRIPYFDGIEASSGGAYSAAYSSAYNIGGIPA